LLLVGFAGTIVGLTKKRLAAGFLKGTLDLFDPRPGLGKLIVGIFSRV
jgi:hypothetical protein